MNLKGEYMIKQECQEMNNSKQELEDHLKEDLDQDLVVFLVLKVSMINSEEEEHKANNKIHLEIYLRNSTSSSAEEAREALMQGDKPSNNKLKAKI